MKGHKTERVLIKIADIDLKMVPLVGWLNSFDQVTTRYCCQGNDKVKGHQPYVEFTCHDDLQLATILRKLGSCATVSVHLLNQNTGSSFSYVARFENEEMLKFVTEIL